MIEQIREVLNRTVRTENGAMSFETTKSDCVDLFATIGALRNASEKEICARFARAFAEDGDLAMKILFFARDIRGGLGERRVFKVILKELARTNPSSVIKNIPYIAEFGRYDDMLVLLDTPCEREALLELKRQFDKDMKALGTNEGEVSLLGKWLPSVNASNANTVACGKKVAKAFGLREPEYRKSLTALRARIRIVENNLREKTYDFDYEALPSRALFKYRKAFQRNDSRRYEAYEERVICGEARMNTSTLLPYDVVRSIVNKRCKPWEEGYDCPENSCEETLSEKERRALDTAWRNLPSYEGDEALVVVDGSESMYWGKPCAAAVAMSLAIYIAEHNRGEFQNRFITFSRNPALVEIKGEDICEKVQYCMGFNEVANTNIKKVFQQILRAAIVHHIPQESMVKRIIIVSDMEFDGCADDADVTNFERAKEMFELVGYTLPEIVFWNVQSRNSYQPVTMNEQGVALVSGYTPRLFSLLLKEDLSPYAQMMEIVSSDRYSKICA